MQPCKPAGYLEQVAPQDGARTAWMVLQDVVPSTWLADSRLYSEAEMMS